MRLWSPHLYYDEHNLKQLPQDLQRSYLMESTTIVPAHLTNSTLASLTTTITTIPSATTISTTVPSTTTISTTIPSTTTLQTTTSLVDETTIHYDTTPSTTFNETRNESDRLILSTNEPDMVDTTFSTAGEEIVETTIISATSTTTRNARSFNTETTTLVAIPLLSLQLPDRNSLNDDSGIDIRNVTANKNDTEDKLPSSSTPINQHSSEASRTVKTILYAFVIFICIIAAGMLMHLLVFHMYICTKGLTTYEYLKPPIPTTRLTSPTSPRESRKGYDPTVGISSAGKNGKRAISSGSRASANMSTKLGGGEGANNVQYDDGSEGDQTNMSIEEESEAIWTTMTEIDLNAPSDFIGGTLPRNMNTAGLGAGGGIVYQPSEFPSEENDLERINNEKNKTLNAMSLAGGNYLLKSSDAQKGKKKKSKNNSTGKSKDKETESSSGEKKTKSSFSKKWNDLFGSGGSSNKVNPTASENEDNNVDT